jgi:acetylornithine/succinyldiaminopimelate/putrescine aminotransferase
MNYATVENTNGYIFHKTQIYDSDTEAVRAALKAAKRKKIDIDQKSFFICLPDVCGRVNDTLPKNAPKRAINIKDYV